MIGRRKLAAAVGLDDKMPPDALEVPTVEQETDFSCGAAALLAVLRFFDVDDGRDEGELYGELGTTPEDGTIPEKMVRAANRRGLRANWRPSITVDDLRDGVADGVPVILNVQEWDERPKEPEEHTEDGHYVVLVGVDEDAAYVMNPSVGRYEAIPLGELEERWHDDGAEHGGIFIMAPRRAKGRTVQS